MLYNSGSMWPSVVVHEHWPVCQRMIVEMGDYDHLEWTIRSWRRVHWSDESRFLLRPTDSCARVWRQRNTSFQDNHPFGYEPVLSRCRFARSTCTWTISNIPVWRKRCISRTMGCVKCHVYFSTFVFANESWFLCVYSFKFHFPSVWYGAAKINHTRKVAS
jgi:hypothetical protein